MKKAFTLLEMLVVIGIIMILVGVMTASYSTAQKKARDSRRASDLKAIQSALEQYYSICEYTYPLPASVNVRSGTGTIICTVTNPDTTLMSPVPVDPLNTGTHIYSITQTTPNEDYTINAVMEVGPTISVKNQQ